VADLRILEMNTALLASSLYIFDDIPIPCPACPTKTMLHHAGKENKI